MAAMDASKPAHSADAGTTKAPASATRTATTNGSISAGAGTGAGAGGTPAATAGGRMPLPAGRTMADAERVLRGIMTYRPPATIAECRTRKETRRVISRYTTALGLSPALGISASSPHGGAVPAGSGDSSGDARDTSAVQQTPLRVVHVAGTKGKGSTCAFVESILRAHGLRTGACAGVSIVAGSVIDARCRVRASHTQASFRRRTW